MNHLDFNRANNNIHNLEWCSQRQNLAHSQGTPVVITKDDYRHEFESVSKAAEHLKMKYSNFIKIIGKRKTRSGYEINYMEDNEDDS